jgi:hypothetical protein
MLYRSGSLFILGAVPPYIYADLGGVDRYVL